MVKLEITKEIEKRIACLSVLILGMLYIVASQHVSLGMKYQRVLFNGEYLCSVNGFIDVEETAKQMRKELSMMNDERLAIDYRIAVEDTRRPFELLLTEEEFEQEITHRLIDSAVNGGVKGYTVEIEGYHATFSSIEDVKSLFSGVKNKVDESDAFVPVFKKQDGHIKGMMTASLEPAKTSVWESDIIPEEKSGDGISAGVTEALMNHLEYAMANPYKGTYQTGILDLEFIENIDIYESFVPEETIADVETELEEVTKEKENMIQSQKKMRVTRTEKTRATKAEILIEIRKKYIKK